MKFTKAEISEDGKLVRLTMQDDRSGVDAALHTEVYHVWWKGSGRLSYVDQFAVDRITRDLAGHSRKANLHSREANLEVIPVTDAHASGEAA